MFVSLTCVALYGKLKFVCASHKQLHDGIYTDLICPQLPLIHHFATQCLSLYNKLPVAIHSKPNVDYIKHVESACLLK